MKIFYSINCLIMITLGRMLDCLTTCNSIRYKFLTNYGRVYFVVSKPSFKQKKSTSMSITFLCSLVVLSSLKARASPFCFYQILASDPPSFWKPTSLVYENLYVTWNMWDHHLTSLCYQKHFLFRCWKLKFCKL